MPADMIWVRPVNLPWVPDGTGERITREGARVARTTYINRRLVDKSLEIFTPTEQQPAGPTTSGEVRFRAATASRAEGGPGPAPDDEF
jgi:hypothetical protein